MEMGGWAGHMVILRQFSKAGSCGHIAMPVANRE